MLVFGLTLFGLGEALLIASNAGVSPWTVFGAGYFIKTQNQRRISNLLDQFGHAHFVVASKAAPGLGSVLNHIILASVKDYAQP